MFETKVISDPEQFNALKLEWNMLLQRSLTNTIFLTWEWLYTWWEVFGHGGRLFIVAVRDGSGELIGLAPLFVRKTRYYSMPVKEMCFIGTGLSDRQDFLIADGDARVLNEIVSMISRHEREWDIVQLDQIPGESLFASEDFEAALHAEYEDSSLCPYVRIDGSWEGYLRGLSRKFRKDIRNKTNNISRVGTWELILHADINDFHQIVAVTSEIESHSKKKNTGKAFWSDGYNKNFFERFYSRAAEKGWIDFSVFYLNAVPISYLIGFVYNKTYSAYNTAYRDDFFEVSPGKLIIHEKIKWCFAQGQAIREFDFLRGDFYIKSLWSSDNRRHFRKVFFRDSLYTRLIRLAVFRVRPMLKKLIKKRKGNEMQAVLETKG